MPTPPANLPSAVAQLMQTATPAPAAPPAAPLVHITGNGNTITIVALNGGGRGADLAGG